MVDGAVPEVFVEGQRQGGQFSQLEHHAADGKAQQARAACALCCKSRLVERTLPGHPGRAEQKDL